MFRKNHRVTLECQLLIYNIRLQRAVSRGSRGPTYDRGDLFFDVEPMPRCVGSKRL